MVKGSVEHRQLDEAARLVLNFMTQMDPTWGDRIKVVEGERGWEPLQIIAALIANTLDREEHMNVQEHPIFQANFISTGSGNLCPVCGKEWTAEYPGQPVCSNECAQRHYGSPKTAWQKQLDEMTPEERQAALVPRRVKRVGSF
jgi:hypothetical protein